MSDPALARCARRVSVPIGHLATSFPMTLGLLVGLVGLLGCDDDQGRASDPVVDAMPTDDAALPDDAAPADDADPPDDCRPGTDDCRCLADGTCRLPTLVCTDGRCVDPDVICDPAIERCPPADPRCYTPCQGDLLADDGSLRVCSSEGLMRGCLEGRVCDRGTCVPAGGVRKQAGLEPGACVADADCPEHQGCMAGRCYSDCETGADCTFERVCRRHVCRTSCIRTDQCGQGRTCHRGACVPLAASGEAEPSSTGLGFEVSSSVVRFTGSISERSFTIANTGHSALEVTVRKDTETRFGPGGSEEVLDAPLSWLAMGVDELAEVQSFAVTVEPEAMVEVRLAGADGGGGPWRGRLAVEAADLAPRTVSLAYSAEVGGRWAGTAFAFGTFPDGATDAGDPLDDWVLDPGGEQAELVPNAFIQAWSGYRTGVNSAAEMEAIIDATLTGSWDFPRVHTLCREAGFDADTICVPFGGTGSRSVISYRTGNYARVPTGVVASDFALEIESVVDPELEPLCAGSEHCFTGRIDSDTALQYAGDPAVALGFAIEPSVCGADDGGGTCRVDVERFTATVGVGARAQRPAGQEEAGGCAGASQSVEAPWLVPGLSPLASPVGDPTRWAECHLEAGAGDPGPGANPIPDGRPRTRTLELIDGMMIEQRFLTLIVKETIDPFHGGAPLSTYLYVVLERAEEAPGEVRAIGNAVNAASLDDDLALGPREMLAQCDLDGFDADDLEGSVRRMLGGQMNDLPDDEAVHSLCIWSEEAEQGGVRDEPRLVRHELVDGGPEGDRRCPPGAEIVFFTTPDDDDPAGWACNREPPESCIAHLQGEIDQGASLRFEPRATTYLDANSPSTGFDLVYRCEGAGAEPCGHDRFDLMRGRTFGVAHPDAGAYSPLRPEVARAFRYKTQFVDRTGGAQVGFAPVICQPGVGLNPYCYDPVAIEQARRRIDCVLNIYSRMSGEEGDAGRAGMSSARLDTHDEDLVADMRALLAWSFDGVQIDNPFGDPIVEHGFERLYAEFVIMLGDDAYTQAFSSRFDLAGINGLAFEGTAFEDDGIDLSGPAGYEMYKLYQATQYYGLVLDRFFGMSVTLWHSLGLDPGDRVITPGTVTTWIDRVVRASTQSANAWSEIARRYQAFNRADLARRVLVRAYTRAYQESLVLRSMMTAITAVLAPGDVPQVEAAIERAQTRYRVAMLDMQDRFDAIGDRLDPFGLPPEYIPFPALDEGGDNGFEVMLDRAMQRMAIAREDEANAIAARRSFDVDAAAFQSELVTLRTRFEAELGAICGTFFGDDERVYPALPRYAHLDPDLAELDDPCGQAGNGALWSTMGDLGTQQLDLQRVRRRVENVQSAMNDARLQVADHCRLIIEDVDRFLEDQGVIDGIAADNDRMQSAITQLDKVHTIIDGSTIRASEIAEADDPWEGAGKGITSAIYLASAAVNLVATSVLEGLIDANNERIRELDREYEAYTIGRECAYLQIDLAYTLRDLHREQLLVEFDVLDAIANVQVELSNVQSLVLERSRLEAEWQDTQQLIINGAAARSDPNQRIFKNDAIINADRSFERALSDAWKATRMFEYYTAQSYPDRDGLFLIRMVERGDLNLRRYLQELEDSYFDFEQQFGNPDTRVAVISMRDDVFGIRHLGADADTLSLQERVDLFREALTDPRRLDAHGGVELSFPTTFDALSPLTVNHKILFVEVAIFGEGLGDDIGRIYLTQRGTGVVQGTDGGRRFFALPPRTAVIDPLFNDDNGGRVGQIIGGNTRSIHRSYRFRDRPMVQTDWALVLDQRHEEVNRDIDLNGIDDIVVYIYYTDFTAD